MKQSFFLFIFSCIILDANAQATIKNAIPSVQFADVNGRFIPMGDNGVQGNPYLFENFGIGKLMLLNGVEAIDSNLNYSLFDHKLYFIKNKGMYLVNEAVKSFELSSLDKENSRMVKIFSSGYPNVENNTTSTFYELVAEGALYQMLKFSSKQIKESTAYGGAPIKEYTTDHMYCIYSKLDKKMLFIGNSLTLKNLKKTLPEKKIQLDHLMETMHLNLKKDEDVGKLFEKLN